MGCEIEPRKSKFPGADAVRFAEGNTSEPEPWVGLRGPGGV